MSHRHEAHHFYFYALPWSTSCLPRSVRIGSKSRRTVWWKFHLCWVHLRAVLLGAWLVSNMIRGRQAHSADQVSRCGNTSDHCGAGCVPAFGVCSLPASSSLPSPSQQTPLTCPSGAVSTVLVTETVRKTLTNTTLVRSTSTVLSTSVATSTSVVTSTEAVQKTVTVLFRTTSTVLETNTITVVQTNTPPPELRTVTFTVTVVSVRTNPIPVPTTVTATTTVAAPAMTITKTVISTCSCPSVPGETTRLTRTITVTEDDGDPWEGTWTREWTRTRRRTRTRTRTWNGLVEEEVDVEVSIRK